MRRRRRRKEEEESLCDFYSNKNSEVKKGP